MARSISPAMHERARFVGGYIKSHKGEAGMAELMRRAQAAFRGRGGHHESMPTERNPRGGGKLLLVLGGVALVGLALHKVEAAKPKPVNLYDYPLYPTGVQVPAAGTGSSTGL